jgi:hypothetical protein
MEFSVVTKLFMLKRAIRLWAIAFVALASFVPAAQPAQAGLDVAWNVTCDANKWAREDPIVFPGQSNLSHMHTFFANTTVDANTTTQSLLASGPSSCERGFQDADHSAYWVPALYKKTASGSLEELHPAKPSDFSVTTYYRRAGGLNGDKIAPFPQGLRMIAGDAKATTPQDHISFRCINTDNGGIQNKSGKEFPTCDANQTLIGDILFPNCWDGTHLDSADHKSHMAYSKGATASCPADHPVKLPQVTFEPRWRAINGPGSQFMLSSGGPYTLHGDFFAAWDPRIQQALVNDCPNAGKGCTFKKLSDLHLNTAAVTQAQIDAQTAGAKVQGATTHNTPLPTASTAPATAAAPLPQTGPLTTFSGVAGVGTMGYAWYAYKSRRKSLVDALRGNRT